MAQDLKDLFAPARELGLTQPIHFVGDNQPPLLLMTGASDEQVRSANSVNLANRTRAAGGQARLIVYPRRGHAGILFALAAPLRRLDPVLRIRPTLSASKRPRAADPQRASSS
jgi:acetyl esterase/lipase